MQSEQKVGVWAVLPTSLRTAIILAIVTSITAGTLLYRSGSRSSQGPEFSRGGKFSGITDGGTAIDDFSLQTSSPPSTTPRLRSKATLTAPDREGASPGPGATGGLPTFGTYIYKVEGTESVSAFGSRSYPPEMTMTVQRPRSEEETAEQGLSEDELVFDLFFSEEHEEREIVSYGPDGIAFTYEAGSITFGPTTQDSETTYEPPILQVPLPVKDGATYAGTTRATDVDGSERRVEDWTVTVEGAEEVEALGETISAWRVKIDRQSRPGSAEQLTRSRTYWFDASRAIWVKWEETSRSTQDFGPGTFTYTTHFIATLDRLEPL